MGHASVVYGHILGAPGREGEFFRRNKMIIDSLPEVDDQFPWIERNMFLVPVRDTHKMYRDQVIVFGASYKSVEKEWDQWLEKFESILKQLYWLGVTVHLETELVGDHTFTWVYGGEQEDNFFSDDPHPTSVWDFKGHRKFYDRENTLPGF